MNVRDNDRVGKSSVMDEDERLLDDDFSFARRPMALQLIVFVLIDLLDHECVKLITFIGGLSAYSTNWAWFRFHFIHGPDLWFFYDEALFILSPEASSLLYGSLKGLTDVIIFVAETLWLLIEHQLLSLRLSGLREVNLRSKSIKEATRLIRIWPKTFLSINIHQVFSTVDFYYVSRCLEIVEWHHALFGGSRRAS